MSESNSLLLQLDEFLKHFEKFKVKCNCLKEFEDEISIFSLSDKIEKAQLIEDLDEMKKICQKIKSDIELIHKIVHGCI